MKSVVKNSSTSATKFPKLMVSKWDKAVVLFERDSRGVQVSKGRCKYIGYYSTKWDMSMFEDFHGSVTLSNED